MIMFLPIKLLTFLHVTRTQRLALIGIFSVGGIVIACALVRLTQIVAQARSDPVGLAVWGIVEASMSVVVGSLPALKSFFGRAWERTVKRRSGQLGSAEIQWSGRTRPGRVVISDDPEKSLTSADVAALRSGGSKTTNGRWSSNEQSPRTPNFPLGIRDDDYDDQRMLRMDSTAGFARDVGRAPDG